MSNPVGMEVAASRKSETEAAAMVIAHRCGGLVRSTYSIAARGWLAYETTWGEMNKEEQRPWLDIAAEALDASLNTPPKAAKP